jgi:hypothetical protein
MGERVDQTWENETMSETNELTVAQRTTSRAKQAKAALYLVSVQRELARQQAVNEIPYGNQIWWALNRIRSEVIELLDRIEAMDDDDVAQADTPATRVAE